MKKLNEALHVIQEECNKYHNCYGCPMSKGEDDEICCVSDLTPDLWKINDAPQKALL